MRCGGFGCGCGCGHAAGWGQGSNWGISVSEKRLGWEKLVETAEGEDVDMRGSGCEFGRSADGEEERGCLGH